MKYFIHRSNRFFSVLATAFFMLCAGSAWGADVVISVTFNSTLKPQNGITLSTGGQDYGTVSCNTASSNRAIIRNTSSLTIAATRTGWTVKSITLTWRGQNDPTSTSVLTITGGTFNSLTSITGSSTTVVVGSSNDNNNYQVSAVSVTFTEAPACVAPSSVAIGDNWLWFAGETMTLTATPTGGNGPITYQWYKGGKADGNAIDGATNATFSKTCAFEDAGSYYCKVTCGGTQSTWGQNGDAYEVKVPRLYVKTGRNDGVRSDYGNVDFTRATASTATASISLDSNLDYCFNIADGCGHYYGNSGTMQYNNTGWITNVSPQDCGLTTTNAGTYIFTINYSTWSQLTTTITFPSCTDPGLAFASASKSVTLCDDAPTNALTNTHGVTVSYESSDTDVAEVASDGTITLVGAGETTITASSLEQTISAVTYCADNASYTLTVNASTAAGLAYGTATMEKNVGDANFTNTLTNTNSLSVTYSSSDEDVATVASDGTVTIKAAGTTTITASSAQQKVSSTCYAEGEASYTLTVYPVYTVSYNAMGGTCSPTSANTTTSLGKVTLPTPTHASYSFLGWYNTAGTKVGDADEEYTPTANITLYAKWQGDCAGGGGSTTITLTHFEGSNHNVVDGKPDAQNKYLYGYTSSTLTEVNALTITTDGSTDVKGVNSNAELELPYNKKIRIYSDHATSTFAKGFSAVTAISFKWKFKASGSSGTTSRTVKYTVKVGSTTVADAVSVTGKTNDGYATVNITDLSSLNGYVEIGMSEGSSTNDNWYLDDIAITYNSSCYTVTYDGNGATSGYVNDPRQELIELHKI